MNNQYNLGDANTAHLYALSQQGNNVLSHQALTQQATAQAAMRDLQNERSLEVPKVNFYPSRHPDPHKARKKDIKQAYKLLSPSKRSIFNPWRLFFGRKYHYDKQTHICVVDGCDCATLIQHDNIYSKIFDEDSNKSLWQIYWQNPVNGQSEAFIAKEKVTNGRKMRGTYCPEHLHLYHLLCKWETEEEKVRMANPKTFKQTMKKGVSMVTVPISTIRKKDPTPAFLEKYESFFAELEKDSRNTNGINILHYKNPSTNVNDVTMIVFDLRIFQEELNAINQPTLAFQQMLNNQVNEQKGIEEQLLGVSE